MAYLTPKEFVEKMVDAGESKVLMAPRDVLIRAFMAGAILAIAVALAVTATVQTGYPIVGAIVFPVGFCILNLMGFDLLTGVFALAPLALFAGRRDVTLGGVLKNWLLVFIGNYLGALTVAVLVAIAWTFDFSSTPTPEGLAVAKIADARTLGFMVHGAPGMVTIFVKAILCNWMVSLGVVGAMLSSTVGGKVIAMWMPILIFFGLVFEHAVVNMYLFPLGMMMGAKVTVAQYLLWNEIPALLGNWVGGLGLTGLTLYTTHYRTAPSRRRTAHAAAELAR